MTIRRRQRVASRRLLAAIGLAASPLLGCAASDGAGPEQAGPGPDTGARQERLSTTYQVGPSRTYKTLSQVTSLLQPGDVVEVDGNATYAGGIKFSKAGTAAAPITIRGVRVGGKRPVFSGSTNTFEMNQSNYVLEGVDVTGGSTRCIFHHANNITIRDSVVHDCPGHGILGADADSGSITLDYVEVYKAGSGTTRHPIYIATDEKAFPGSVFRMQHCYVHDTSGGNNVKSRAERNEIYYNWIEGAMYKELELIGLDGVAAALPREDGDVVGNVFRKTSPGFAVRLGGDSGNGGGTNGRYRFVNNTFILASGSNAAIHAFDRLESIEAHNNVFYNPGGGAVTLLRDEGTWVHGSALLAGNNNWVPNGTTIPSAWKGTKTGANPGFAGSSDFRPSASSPLIDAALSSPPTIDSAPFPNPLDPQLFQPPPGGIEALGAALPRPVVGALDVGAFEFGNGAPASGAGGSSGTGAPAGAGGSSGAPAGAGGGTDAAGAGGSTDAAGAGGSTDAAGAGGSTDAAGAGGSTDAAGAGGSTDAAGAGGTDAAGEGPGGSTGDPAGGAGQAGDTGTAGAGSADSGEGGAAAGGSDGGAPAAAGGSDGGGEAGGSGGASPSGKKHPHCKMVSAGKWKTGKLAKHPGQFTMSMDVTPEATGIDAAIGLSDSPALDRKEMSALVRFSPDGTIDAMDGQAYAAASAVHYVAGQTYGVRITADMVARTYAVHVTMPDGSTVAIAKEHAFQKGHGGGKSLEAMTINQAAKAGAFQVCGLPTP
jgi:hypothetical protein